MRSSHPRFYIPKNTRKTRVITIPRCFPWPVRIGDLLAAENEKGKYEPRLDSDWDTYMWLEACRLLERDLGEERRVRWRREIEKNVVLLVDDTKERIDFPWYHSPFIGTSPNHYAQWASILHFAGGVFQNKEWEALGAKDAPTLCDRGTDARRLLGGAQQIGTDDGL